MTKTRKTRGRPPGELKKRVELLLTPETIETLDRLRGSTIDRSAWVSTLVNALNTGNMENVSALLNMGK